MQTEISPSATHKVAFTLKEAARASGLSRSLLYVAIGRGALRARKCGARTLILDSDLRRFLRGLPAFGKLRPDAG
jgi:Helix-turn-helix domain